MKITINTEVLKKYNLSLGEFLTLLLGHYDVDVGTMQESLIKKRLVDPNLFKEYSVVLSDNTKNLVARILMESNEKAVKSGLDFEKLATTLQNLYPVGCKPGTSYPWRGDTEDIAQKLRVLVVNYDFSFTEEEAVAATKEYVESFKNPKRMHLLKNFLLTSRRDDNGKFELESMFMTIIENNRPE